MKKEQKKPTGYIDFLKAKSSYTFGLPHWVVFIVIFLLKITGTSMFDAGLNSLLYGGILTLVMYYFWKKNVK